MPAAYWLPLPDLTAPQPPERLHAAFSGWFDAKPDAHHSFLRPYVLSPSCFRSGSWGVEISVLTTQAAERLLAAAGTVADLRVGPVRSQVGNPVLLDSTTWHDLRVYDDSTSWRVRFLTPVAFRVAGNTSVSPTPAVVLHSPAMVWRHFGPRPEVSITTTGMATLGVSKIDVAVEQVVVNRRSVQALRGSVSYRCTERSIATEASALFRLARFSGVGSFRCRGLGIVSVSSA